MNFFSINEQLRIRNEKLESQKLSGVPVMGVVPTGSNPAPLRQSTTVPVSSPPTKQAQNRTAIPTRNKREEIVNEIILTERKYVESLKTLIEVWYKVSLARCRTTYVTRNF
jgi:hypothetical protein